MVANVREPHNSRQAFCTDYVVDGCSPPVQNGHVGSKPTSYEGRKRSKPPVWRRHFLFDWRIRRGLTQEELASRIGMSHASIQRLENDKQGLTLKVLDKLAVALQTTRSDLMDRKPGEGD